MITRKMDNKELVKYFYEVVVSQNLLHSLPQYLSDSCILRTGEELIPLGVNGMRQHLMAVRATYPDYTMKVIRQYADRDYVVSEFFMEGTHEEDWIGIRPTHRKLSFTGINIDKVTNGKIVEHSGCVNTFETLLAHNLIKPAP